MDFAQLIKTESDKLEALHVAIHETLQFRDRDTRSRKKWEEACDAFHTYVSALDPHLDRACNEDRYFDRDILEFVVCFIEVDPWFFRSGYLKQILLTRLKRSDLKESIKTRLRDVLIDAVNRRGTREYKYYCRLATVIATEQLVSQIESAMEGQNSARSNRAKMMLDHINQKRSNANRKRYV